MRLLVLGGTHHVGRAVVEAALAGGDLVTTLNRGVSGARPPVEVETLRVDRTDQVRLRAALGEREWDAVIDTWSGPPCVVRDSAKLLAGRVGHYCYVSSRSVYRSLATVGLDESAPVVDGDPDESTDEDYARAKRGAELAVLAAFGSSGSAMLARAGLILGPYERVGRLPWWLRRVERGGDVLAPGPRDRPLQYVDGRDLARWLLAMARGRRGGVFNAVSRQGHATMGGLLDAAVEVTGGAARLVWVEPELVLAAGISPWTELPIWVPPTGDLVALHDGDVSAALAAGLTCRPIRETVLDTWRWLRVEGDPAPVPGRSSTGLDPAREREVLAGL